MTARTSHPETRRRQILAAAHRCFARHGFHATTMQDVADEAGLSVGALYRYFRGKEGLIEGLAEWGRAQKGGMLADLAGGEGAESLSGALSEILGFLEGEAATRAARLDVRLWGEALGHEGLSRVVRESVSGLADPLAAYLGREREAGRVRRDVEPAGAARLLVAVLLGLELQKALDPELDVGSCGRELGRLLEGLRPGR